MKPPWSVEMISGGLKVYDANGPSLAYSHSLPALVFALQRLTVIGRIFNKLP